MPIDAAEVVLYGCANHAENDTATQGGAISTSKKLAMVMMAANDTLEMLSSAAGDTTQQVQITFRTAAGVITQDTKTLNGTTVVAFTGTANRLLKAVITSGTPTGTVTIRRAPSDTVVCTLEPGITEVRTMFYDLVAGAAQKIAYEKGFVKNLDGVLAVTSATLKLTLEPANVTDFELAVEDAVDDNGTSTNRLTAPSGVSAFRQINVAEAVPGNSLGPGNAIGFWLKVTLAADNVAVLDDWSVELAGAAI